jgi:hypothetical protein
VVKADLLTRTLRDAAAFVPHWDEIHQLRRDLSVESDVLLNPLHFLAATDGTRRSCSVACWRSGRLIGVLYATEHCVKGLGTGYAVGGDYSGRGLLLCSAADEQDVLTACMERIFRDGVHSLHLRLLPRERTRFALPGMKVKFLDAVIPGDRLLLKPTFQEFLGSLGRHTRRNVRACTRKTQAAGIEFVPSLSREEYESAVARLNAETDFPADPLRLARDERLLALHGGGQRFGLRDAGGKLIAVLCGFSLGARFHLLTQLNDLGFERLSLSLVLRGAAIGHLIETGHTELQFMGGSSLSFGRFCQPENYRSIFVDRDSGLAAAVKRLCSAWVRLTAGPGTPVAETLAFLCSGYLECSRLSDRTALRPAAMVMRQRSAA